MNKFQDIKKYLDKAKKNIKNSISKKQDRLLAAIEQKNLTIDESANFANKSAAHVISEIGVRPKKDFS